MLSVELISTPFWQSKAEAYLIFINENLDSITDAAALTTIEQEFYPHLKQIFAKHEFAGKKGQIYVLTAMYSGVLTEFIFIGVGSLQESWDKNLEVLRRCLGKGIIEVKKKNLSSAVITLPASTPCNVSDEELCKQLTTTAIMAAYDFSQYKKSSREKKSWACTLSFIVGNKDSLAEACEAGNIMGRAINDARYWADSPPNVITPTKLSQEAEHIANMHNLKCTIFGRERALDLGMGAFLAVETGSDQPGKFVILEYQTQVKDAPTVALVGKGVTFDTGGISLKPASSMTGMKYDMSGAAAVIATMKIISQLKPNINVVGITPLVENMPSGKATRQDDVVIAMNGKSIEIKNTDAEGRLILADALHYAEKFYQPEAIIDIATLTGACSYALGSFYAGLMSWHDAFREDLIAISKKTGDRIWPLPLDVDFKPANDSYSADISNSGSSSYKAGTITAACFLSEFVETKRWAHLDIAGTAYEVPGISYFGKGATGIGIRLMTEFVMSYQAGSQ